MPARTLCQKFFRGALSLFHQYRQNALLDATVALTRGASLRSLPSWFSTSQKQDKTR